MVIGKIKPVATIVAQFAAGVEIEAIQHEGKMYLPFVGMGEFEAKDSPAPTKKTEPVAEAEAPTKKPAKSASEGKQYTEDELMEMSTKDLLKMCKELGIDPDKEEGKNTNKKLRLLILDAQNASDEDEADDADEDDEDNDSDEKGSEEENDLSTKIAEILEDFDGGKKNKKKAIAAICALADDADKKAVTELVDKFEDDADADIDDIADELAEVLGGASDDEDDDEDEEEKPAPKKSPKKSKKDENLVDVKDLKVGDRVSVWWDDDNQEWYDGEVKSISKKGKVVIAYDDDTEEAIDEEIHTKIKLLEE